MAAFNMGDPADEFLPDWLGPAPFVFDVDHSGNVVSRELNEQPENTVLCVIPRLPNPLLNQHDHETVLRTNIQQCYGARAAGYTFLRVGAEQAGQAIGVPAGTRIRTNQAADALIYQFAADAGYRTGMYNSARFQAQTARMQRDALRGQVTRLMEELSHAQAACERERVERLNQAMELDQRARAIYEAQQAQRQRAREVAAAAAERGPVADMIEAAALDKEFVNHWAGVRLRLYDEAIEHRPGLSAAAKAIHEGFPKAANGRHNIGMAISAAVHGGDLFNDLRLVVDPTIITERFDGDCYQFFRRMFAAVHRGWQPATDAPIVFGVLKRVRRSTPEHPERWAKTILQHEGFVNQFLTVWCRDSDLAMKSNLGQAIKRNLLAVIDGTDGLWENYLRKFANVCAAYDDESTPALHKRLVALANMRNEVINSYKSWRKKKPAENKVRMLFDCQWPDEPIITQSTDAFVWPPGQYLVAHLKNVYPPVSPFEH
ncbi:hypothetical protein QBC42DRAFT_296308 [Cladorrhinum samala]|uniref:Uncharacterized protein n=1 Tax=Cladorrhinum samala TaxID=585594 RepID=A0AAV9HQM6_9PEZI|nr:hypothetical protein QBC42DRAFT_296308 [Cladorrhinum samala]